VLELGARGSRPDPGLTGLGAYVGLDVRAGPNVDAVGDAHRLSALVEGPFDAIYSISTFEHLAMPWTVVLECNRVLRPGGLLFAATHHTWPPHELPWDFWRYSRGAFGALLNAATGFEIVRCEEGLPALVVPMVAGPAMREVERNPSPLGVSVLARKTGEPRADLRWDLAAADVADGSYPVG
jgi:SAM-dependent methyltransferase